MEKDLQSLQRDSMRRRLLRIWLFAVLATAINAEESCVDRCENGFDSRKPCQCDSMCRYYESCCQDYDSACRIKTRGDTFAFAEDDEEMFDYSTVKTLVSASQGWRRPSSPPPSYLTTQDAPDVIVTNMPTATSVFAPTTTEATTTAAKATTSTTKATKATTTNPPDPEAVTCSGRPFDSFLQLKNGSVYAFRGEYFFQLDSRAVMPGYPKLIKDVWGISGPIDAAFTRINCQGKTYIFKGNKYWRYEDDVLDSDFPRDISVGFEKIPDDVDAAFAIPATSHHGKEKVYFFKGDQYYQYEFKRQPSHEECIKMSETSPSTLFSRYTDLYYGTWEDSFSLLFKGIQGHHGGPRFINRDWIGIRAPVDAVMAGRLYISPARRRSSRWRQNGHGRQAWGQQAWGQQDWGQQDWGPRWPGQSGQRRRQNRSPQWDPMTEWGINQGQEYMERYRSRENRRQDLDQQRNSYHRQQQQQQQQQQRQQRQQQQRDYDYDYRDRSTDGTSLDTVDASQPVQNVYFFKQDKYYRVDLLTKRVDIANPPYPRSIAKYWLGCPEKEWAEKK